MIRLSEGTIVSVQEQIFQVFRRILLGFWMKAYVIFIYLNKIHDDKLEIFSTPFNIHDPSTFLIASIILEFPLLEPVLMKFVSLVDRSQAKIDLDRAPIGGSLSQMKFVQFFVNYSHGCPWAPMWHEIPPRMNHVGRDICTMLSLKLNPSQL